MVRASRTKGQGVAERMRQLVAGNWKMNGLGAALTEVEKVAQAAAEGPLSAEILICPPATLISRAAAVAAGRVEIGGQDCHAQPSGAFTGDVSAEMLRDAGASYVILGHSERRSYHHETDTDVAAKAVTATRAGLIPIICVGEAEAERDAGHALAVVSRQLKGSVPVAAMHERAAIAYEPIWAIGTARTPSNGEIAEMHAHIRRDLAAILGGHGASVRILYGGSVKPSNSREILALPEVGGALVGGASLKADDFCAILRSAAPIR
jgi:triosephosphate isomerase (TIM)